MTPAPTTEGMIRALSPARNAIQIALDKIDACGIRQARAYRALHRVPVLEVYKSRPDTFFRYLSEYRQRSFMSTTEAVEFFKAERARLHLALTGRDPFLTTTPLLKRDLRMVCERLVFARYFHRFGMRVWTIQKAAA